MRIEIDINSDTLIDDIMANYPEASSGMALKCETWSYKTCIFRFVDDETGKEHRVTRLKLRKGLQLLIKKIVNGKLPGLSVKNVTDAGEYDAFGSDALVQCAIFKDVIYG